MKNINIEDIYVYEIKNGTYVLCKKDRYQNYIEIFTNKKIGDSSLIVDKLSSKVNVSKSTLNKIDLRQIMGYLNSNNVELKRGR